MTYYDDKGITLHHGDCLEVMPTLAAQSFDAVICDIPYGTTACAWDMVIPFDAMWANLKRLAKPRAAIVLFGSQPFTSALVMSNVKWFKYEWVWNKHTPTGFLNAAHVPLKSHENILVFSDGTTIYNPQKYLKPYKGARTGNGFTKEGQPAKGEVWGGIDNGNGFRSDFAHPKTIINFPTGNGWDKQGNTHPTQKPLALMEYLVRTYTNPGDRVLDFTSGSGTTLRACKNLGRSCVGIEQDRGYCDATVQRLAPVFEPALIDDGATLEDLPMFNMEAQS